MSKAIWRHSAAILLCLSVAGVAAADTCSPVMEWNRNALAATRTSPPQGALVQIRSMAIVHASMHDAVNTITGEYPTYLPAALPPGGASPKAAAIAAANYALTRLFPAQGWEFQLDPSLSACGLTIEDPGVAVGRAAAAAVLASRPVDEVKKTADPTYVAPNAGVPGVWEVAEGDIPASPKWGQMKTWVIESGSQFRPDAPPALDSGRYARDFNEVKMLGAKVGSARTPEQTRIAHFWDNTPSVIWNSVATGVIERRGLDLSNQARAFALMYIAGADASIACFDAKYTYNFWRPIAAIRRAEEDGNDATLADTEWEALVHTHPHPEYPSGHTTNSSAMATVLELLFGDAPGVAIHAEVPNPEVPNATLTADWSTFSQGVDEVIDARVYIGFHFRTSDETGARIGGQVARFVMNHILRD
ncbi:MAG TPA: vanadium-dependent haloperoxidase [Vicinamibacterales bacterium]|nr:vanadium-dependent haloperoxidase [Vicinamibacterales bacterium]